MTTAQEVEQYADKFGDSYPATVVLLRQYATILRQTTEGTNALVSDLSEEANIVHCYEEMTNLCRTYEQRMKVVEAERFQKFIQPVTKATSALRFIAEYGANNTVAAKAELRAIAEQLVELERALSPKVDQEPVQTIGGNDPEYLAEVFWRNKDRRSGGERRVHKVKVTEKPAQPESAEPVGYTDQAWLSLLGIAQGSFQETRICSVPTGSREIPLYTKPTAADEGMVRVSLVELEHAFRQADAGSCLGLAADLQHMIKAANNTAAWWDGRNARLKAAMDKYSEDEMLKHLPIAVAALKEIYEYEGLCIAGAIAKEALAQIDQNK